MKSKDKNVKALYEMTQVFMKSAAKVGFSAPTIIDVMIMYGVALAESNYTGKEDYKTYLRDCLEFYINMECK
jgi:hypothetical protein